MYYRSYGSSYLIYGEMLNLHIDYVSIRLKYYIFLVPVIIITSFALSYITNRIFLFIQNIFKDYLLNSVDKKIKL